MAHAKRGQQMLGVMLLDLDRFKTINETLGHNLGDRLLVGVAERLLDSVGEGATLARLTGDEFIFLIPQVESVDELYQHATRVIQSLKDPFHLGTQEVHTSCGLGIVMYPGDGEDSETLLRNAETAMYRAKEQGRNNYQLYTAVMNAKAFKQLLMENSLRRALERNEFIVHYQPQVDLVTRKVIGAEALVRWQHPDLGLVFPTEFIGLAEDTGLIVPLGEWVLKESCRQNKAWQDKGLPPITVAVNLSARQFLQKDLALRVADILKESRLDPQWLGLEITESVALKDADFTLASLHDLRSMGLRLALDDFGTGYSSLSYLKRFPIQTIKIDQSFVRDLATDPNDAAIAAAVMALARSLKLTVVAEGVETEDQLEFLRAQGCRYIQGYLMSHPLPNDEFEHFLAQPQVTW
jgi:diguanylate cyclase (GGDEF)-like protein